MKSKKNNKQLKEFLIKVLKEIRESGETTTKPTPVKEPGIKTPSPKKTPRRKLVPDKWPEQTPGPKPKAEAEDRQILTVEGFVKTVKLFNELDRMSNLISENRQIKQEMAMNIEDPYYDEPHPSVRKGIEGGKPTAFTDLEFFGGGQPDYNTLEKLGSEEFNKVIRDVKPFGKMNSHMDFMEAFQLMSSIEMPNKNQLETLAIKKIKEQFGLPDEISDKLEAKLVRTVNKPDEDTDNLSKEVIEELHFTKEELQIIKKHIEKRKIQNALMMGAGFRAHSVFNSIKEDLDSIDERLYPLYEKTMPNVALFMWKTPLEDMMGGVSMMGISKIKKDENNNVRAEAQATIFPILLHETAKAAIELLFANYLIDLTEKYGADVASEIINKSDVFEDEIWMKRIGPTLWKYLHDVIDYVIVHEKEGNYTLVSYLLHDISMMEPSEFVDLMNTVIYDGQKAIDIIEKMVNDIEKDLASEENIPDKTDVENLNKTINASISDLSQIASNAKEKAKMTFESNRNFAEMDIEQLQTELELAVNDERYEDATVIVKMIKQKNN